MMVVVAADVNLAGLSTTDRTTVHCNQVHLKRSASQQFSSASVYRRYSSK
jgi:hypothetical protein